MAKTRAMTTAAAALLWTALAAAVPASAAGVPAPVTGTVVGTSVQPQGRDLGAVAQGQTRSVRLYLQPRDPLALEQFARRVSDPNSPKYGRYLSPARFARRFEISPHQRRRVSDWLADSGLSVTSQTEHYVEASGTVEALERAMGTGVHWFTSDAGTVEGLTGPVRLPAAVASSVLAVAGLATPPAARPASTVDVKRDATYVQAARAVAGQAVPAGDDSHPAVCSDFVGQLPATQLPGLEAGPLSFATCPYVPALLRHAYSVGGPGASGAGRTVAVVGAYGSPTARADLDTFATLTGDVPLRADQYDEAVDPAAWSVTSTCAPPEAWAGEQALDLDSVHGYAPDARIRYAGARSCLNDDLFDAEASIIDSDSADIISNSWAELVHSDPAYLTPDLVAAWNVLFEQAAAEGIGVYVASGDCGDASPDAASTGSNCDSGTTGAQATFPSGSPWVTSVGATTLVTNAQGDYLAETSMGDAVSILPGGSGPWAPLPGVFAFGGGGGPSDFPRPWYQQGVVPDALSRVDGSQHRVTPDVALQGDEALPVLVGYTVDGAFSLMGYGGTSAATPGFAAMQADAESVAGRRIGFANPLLYRLSSQGVFHDVTATSSTAGAPPAVVRDYGPEAGDLRYVLYSLGEDFGLPAGPGYDAATGLGSPSPAYLGWFGSHA